MCRIPTIVVVRMTLAVFNWFKHKTNGYHFISHQFSFSKLKCESIVRLILLFQGHRRKIISFVKQMVWSRSMFLPNATKQFIFIDEQNTQQTKIQIKNEYTIVLNISKTKYKYYEWNSETIINDFNVFSPSVTIFFSFHILKARFRNAFLIN